MKMPLMTAVLRVAAHSNWRGWRFDSIPNLIKERDLQLAIKAAAEEKRRRRAAKHAAGDDR